MNAHPSTPGASIIPTVRYRDVPAAVAWLQDAFAFEPHRLVKDSKGTILYAELTFGTGMVMVAPIQESPFGKLMVQPDEIGGVETQICYLFVPDAKAHYARAKDAGAEIVLDIEGTANGGRGYSCRDLEGHVWNFGTHNPWNGDTKGSNEQRRSRRAFKALAACLLLLAAGAGLYLHKPAREATQHLAIVAFQKISSSIGSAQAEQTPDRTADIALRDMREQLARERLARTAADRHITDIREQLMQERRAREAAELAVRTATETRVHNASPPVAAAPEVPATSSAALKAAEAATAQARVDLTTTRSELATVRSALQAAGEQLAHAQKAKTAAEREAKDARERLAQLDGARDAADQSAKQLRELAARERRARIAAERTLRKAKESPYTPYPLQ